MYKHGDKLKCIRKGHQFNFGEQGEIYTFDRSDHIQGYGYLIEHKRPVELERFELMRKSPVVTKQVNEIVQGTYGRFTIKETIPKVDNHKEGQIHISSVSRENTPLVNSGIYLDKKELLQASELFRELADVIDEQVS